MLKRLLTVFVLLAASLHAQSVRWEPGSGTLAFNQTSQLSLVFEQCDVDGSLALPEVPGLTISPQPNRSESNSFTVINGKASRSRTVTYAFRVRPTERLDVTIPEFQIKTDKGTVTVAPARFSIGDATVGQSSLSLDSIVQSRFTTPSRSVWAGEVFPLIYTLDAAKRYLYQLGSEPEWNPAPLAVEPWSGKPEQVDTVINNDPRVSIIYKTRAYAKAPGSVTLNAATQLVNLATGTSGFTVFARPSLEQFSITSSPASITVKPLPSPAPSGFTGAVGKFTLESQVVPAAATVGEPITWTLTLDGTGNWPDITGLPSRSVSKDFRIVQPQAKRTNKNDALFDAAFSEDIVLIPTKPGAYTLGPVSFSVFNPATGAYENLSTKPVTIQVAPAAGQPAVANPPPAQPGFAAPSATTTPAATAVTPKPPSVLPRDPLAPAGSVSAPVSSRVLIFALVASVLLPLSVWMTLALRRARRTDPARLRREAHARLVATVHQLNTTPSAQLIQGWQRDAALLWNLPQAVPTPAQLTDPVWSALWAETDRALYGKAPLSADWATRASAALAAFRVPAFSAFQLFLPRNILPLVLVAASLAVASSSLAADGRDAYAKADFPAAEKAWRDSLSAASTDWTAHHNLALALIQQNHPGEAAGHALAAFVQQPQNPSVRWHLAYTWKTAGVTPPSATDRATLNAQLASLASPTRWQAALIASAWISALALALGLQGAYAGRPRKFIVGALLTFALLLAAAAGISLRTYGPLADSRAVVVVAPATLRSIPTDLDTQKSSPLSLGTVAVAEKTFLGWTRLSFPNGQTGWARTESLVSLW